MHTDCMQCMHTHTHTHSHTHTHTHTHTHYTHLYIASLLYSKQLLRAETSFLSTFLPFLLPLSLRCQVTAINKLSEAGMHFWDYGNGFLKEAGKADAAVFRLDKQCGAFSYPSYVEDVMGWVLHQ